MEFKNREELAGELLKIADALKELELKKLNLESEQQPFISDFNEVRYRHLTDIENVKDAQSKDLFSDEDRKDIEIEHRLRTDPKARELRTKLNQLKFEVDKTKIEIDHLENKREVLEDIYDYPLPANESKVEEGEKK